MNKKGQALVEYILIIALISVIAIALVNYFGGYLKDAINEYSKRLSKYCRLNIIELPDEKTDDKIIC